MTLALPTDAANYNVHGAWDPNTVYRSDGTKPDMVEYLGAWWYSTFYTEGVVPVNGGGSGWALDPNAPGPNYNAVVPDAPTNLHPGYTSSSAVALFWDVPMVEGEGNVSSYNVYENGALIGTSTTNAFTVDGLEAGHKYSFTVAAADQTGLSGNYALTSSFGVNQNPDPMDNPSITVKTDGAETLSGKTFSPYVDMTLPSTNIQEISSESHLRDFTLAFMQTDNRNISGGAYDPHSGAPTLAWGGIENTTQPTGAIISEVKAVEAEGGTVTVSVGGYNGYDAAVIATQYAASLQETMSASKANAMAISNLTQEYQSLITTYGVHALDFDIENQVTVDNTKANHMRDLALVALEKANPGLHVSFTVATTEHGLANDPNAGSGNDLGVLSQAKHDGVHIDVVNIMTMDYYDGTTADPKFINSDGSYNMLLAAESAAMATEKQLQHLGMTDTTVSITPMIGQNDDYGQTGGDGVQEFFSLKDAQSLEKWAAGKAWVSGMGEWELPRDHAGSAESGPSAPQSTSSGAAESRDWQYAQIFDQITQSGAHAAVAAAHASPLFAMSHGLAGDVLLGVHVAIA